jgi:hypothetical protein
MRAARDPAEPAPARHARTAVVALLGAYALFLAAGNLFLNSGLAQGLANRHPEKFRASWAFALTLWPGHVRVSDLRVAGHVRRTVWSIQADTAAGRVALLPLLAKEVRLPRIEASAVTGGANLIDVQRTPQAPRPGGWTLRFDSVIAQSVRYAYFDGLVLQGNGRGEFGFMKQLRGGPMEILPSHARFDGARLLHDGSALVNGVSAAAKFAIDRHVREDAPGVRKLEKTVVHLALDGTPVGLAIDAAPGAGARLRPDADDGQLAVRLGWVRGSLEAGSDARLEMPIRVEGLGPARHGSGTVALKVEDDEIRLETDLTSGTGGPLEAHANLRTRSREVPLPNVAALVPRTSGRVTGRWQFASLRRLGALLPTSRILTMDGAGSVIADIELADGRLAAGSHLKVPKVAATVSSLGNVFKGDARAELLFADSSSGAYRPEVRAVMDSFTIAPAEAPRQPYVQGRQLTVEASAEGAIGELRDRYEARISFADAEVPDLRVYNRYLPNTRVRLDGGSGRVSGDLRIDGNGRVGAGTLRVAGREIRWTVADLAMQGDIDVTVRLQDASLREHRFAANGTRLDVRRVRVDTEAGLARDDWWGEVTLEQASLDWTRPVRIDGNVGLHMKDLSVLLDLFAQRKDLPDWVGRIVDEGEVTARGRLRWMDDALVLDHVAAANDRFDVLARMRLEEHSLDGELFTRWGLLSLGVEIEDNQRDLHLVNARKWFDGQPALLPP